MKVVVSAQNSIEFLKNCVHARGIVGVLEETLMAWTTALWFNRGMSSKLKSFIPAIFSPVCNGGFGHRIM